MFRLSGICKNPIRDTGGLDGRACGSWGGGYLEMETEGVIWAWRSDCGRDNAHRWCETRSHS